MELSAELLPIQQDERLIKPVYPHQRFLLHEGGFRKLKVHVPTAGGKTLGALFFALRETYANPSSQVRAIFTYPTNLLTRDQFERSIVRGLLEWVGAELLGAGVINPVEKRFVQNAGAFENIVSQGAPTYVFRLPLHLGSRDLYISVITGEGLQRLFTEENIIELGRRKGTHLFQILDVLNQRDHIILSSPDLLGYVAQRCYSVTGNFYRERWKDELEIKLGDHQVVIDEYHFYDPYTYLNLVGSLEKLGTIQWLCLSATGRNGYFSDAEILDPQRAVRERGEMIKGGDRIASYPIDIRMHRSEMQVIEKVPANRSIYFYHSVITAHEMADELRACQVPITEWTGIQKSIDDNAKLVIATSAAEIGLDLPFREAHTEFWGSAWEIPSIIQRIGRVGRSEEAGRSRAHIWVSGREPGLIFNLIKDKTRLSKAEFSDLLLEAFGEETFMPEEYVSYYLWNEDRTKELRRYWQVPKEVSRLRFHFRPPNSQAVFDWAGTRFVYDWIPIYNRYEIEKIKDVTDLPFWQEMDYSEWRVVRPREIRGFYQRYEGKKDKKHRQWFWRTENR